MTWAEMSEPQRVAAIHTIRKEHPEFSSSQIGIEVGCSRDMVMKTMRQHPELGRLMPPRRQSQLKFGRPRSETPTPPQKKHREPAFDPLPGTTPKKLEDIVVGQECRWPVTDDPRVMCGCPVDPDDKDGGGRGRYCPKHAKKSGTRLPALA